MSFKPMLAKEAPADLSTLTYPLAVQPKLDGIRCTIVDGKAVSRSLKPIPNREIREYLSRPEFEGLDGEIVVGSPSDPNAMQNTTTIVMAKEKPAGPDWGFYVFDRVPPEAMQSESFAARYDGVRAYLDDTDPRVHLVSTTYVEDQAEVAVEEARWLNAGYEGAILRDPSAAYKFGRSGKKGPVLKLKRFIDFEAEVVGFAEKMHNANEAKTNELGRTERSTAKEGMVPTGTLGALVCRAVNGPHAGQQFQVGTGFTEEQRQDLWERRSVLRHRTVKIKSFPVGVKDAPRFPVFLGFRDLEVDG